MEKGRKVSWRGRVRYVRTYGLAGGRGPVILFALLGPELRSLGFRRASSGVAKPGIFGALANYLTFYPNPSGFARV